MALLLWSSVKGYSADWQQLETGAERSHDTTSALSAVRMRHPTAAGRPQLSEVACDERLWLTLIRDHESWREWHQRIGTRRASIAAVQFKQVV